MRKTFALALVLCLAGCVLQNRVPPQPIPEHGAVVFVADGAGDFRAASATLRKVLADVNLPVHVETVVWSHGFLRILRDQLDYAFGRAEGYRLAVQIAALRQSHPDLHVYLVGHSAGSVVALAAAESLPPGSIQGMALLAPSVSTFYDLRPALRAVCGHLDVYYSPRDWGYLGIGTGILGTSDRLHAPASGRIGFQRYADTLANAADLEKLRQHPWRFADWRTGNNGGHYGSYQPHYLRNRVVPDLFENDMQARNDLFPGGQTDLGGVHRQDLGVALDQLRPRQ